MSDVSGMNEGKTSSLLQPLLHVAGRGVGFGGMTAGELFLPLTSCSTGESGPCMLLGNEAGPGGGVQMSWPHLLLFIALGE